MLLTIIYKQFTYLKLLFVVLLLCTLLVVILLVETFVEDNDIGVVMSLKLLSKLLWLLWVLWGLSRLFLGVLGVEFTTVVFNRPETKEILR